ncbi:Hypothetical predicted protein [Olea europaea subsp. europaea]|uniref:Prolamin-like domain-containing protein n=1 Tax=Olea europaea subsp. europaea TaxID=158383 RepID=A0A8S0PM59_OLEEU|nr:Hypothetical predicted protein [Olea europaea subsp. europaea]
MVACMVTSAMSRAGAIVSEVAMAPEGKYCKDFLKDLKGCEVQMFKAVFGVPLDSSCCRVVYDIADHCVPKGFILSHVELPAALEPCLPCIPRDGEYCPDK